MESNSSKKNQRPSDEAELHTTGEYAKKGHSKRNKILAGTAIGLLSIGAAVPSAIAGFVNGFPDFIKQKMETSQTNSEIIDIDLKLSETSHTAYTQKVEAKAKYTAELLGADIYFKSDQVDFLAETKMTMKSNTPQATYDEASHHINVRIDDDAIETNINIVPGTIEHTTDGNLGAALVDNLSTTLKAIPWVGDLSALEGITTAEDKSENQLGNTAIVKGLDDTAKTCVPKAWPVLHEAFADGVKNDILLGAQLIDPTLTEDDITVLIGDAENEAENEKQVVGKVSSVDEAYKKMTDALKDKGVELTSQPGTCDLSPELQAKHAGSQTETSNE